MGIDETLFHTSLVGSDRVVSAKERNIELTFLIEPPPECPLNQVDTDVTKVMVDRDADRCRCDVVIPVEVEDEYGTVVTQVSSAGLEECASTAFEEFDCIPEIIDVKESQIVVRTYADETLDIDGLLDALEDVCIDVRLQRVTSNLSGGMAETLKNIDMSDITEKQRETLEVAIREGYYTRPRGISLSELAEHFDISEQALAQRLARAEETVMSQLFA